MRKLVKGPSGCFYQPIQFKPDQLPRFANHSGCLPEKTGLAVVEIRGGMDMEVAATN